MKRKYIVKYPFPLLSLILVCLLGGCISSYQQGKIAMSKVPKNWAGGTQEGDPVAPANMMARWWEAFNSPELSDLVETAYSQNLTLRMATLRILQARAVSNAVRSARYPSVTSNNSIMHTQPSGNATLSDASATNYLLSIDSSWELDLWGRTQKNIEAANADLKQLNAAYEDIALSLGAEISSAYINYAVLQNQIKLIHANIELQKQSLRVTRALFKEGSRTALDVQQARAILAATQARVPNLERSKLNIRNALITLLSLPPGEIDKRLPTGDIKLPVLSRDVPLGVPVDVLRRRPDIRQAEWSVAAAAARAQSSHLEQYPRIRLSGAINLQVADGVPSKFGGGPKKLFNKDSIGFNIGPSVSIPLFNAKRLENNFLAQDAAFQIALTAYRFAVFRGLQDVENALTALAQSRQRYHHLCKSVNAYENAYKIARTLYQEGEGSFQNIIDTQRQLIDQQQTQIAEQGNISLAQISLIRSLGGGWIPEESERINEATQQSLRHRSARWSKCLK